MDSSSKSSSPRSFRPSITALLLLLAIARSGIGESTDPIRPAQVPIESFRLANGLQFLLVQQPESTTVAAGWVVRSGSADDPADHTGISHLLEHMLFKGSRRVGTRQPGRELELLTEIDRLRSAEQAVKRKAAGKPPARQRKLERQLRDLEADRHAAQQQVARLQLRGEFSFLYSQQGGIGLNANTFHDMTLYTVALPSEKLELWFWLESDRLQNPVFRQFYEEIDVIDEERRLRIESQPTGDLDETFRLRFWGREHPYSWNPIGRAGDLETLSRSEAYDFFRRQYRPDRITVALVGGFDPERVERWAVQYFERWKGATEPSRPQPRIPAPAVPTEPYEAHCDCPTQLQVAYPSARFDTEDAHALQLLSAVLNGRTGRLYRRLVLGRGIAFSAYTQQTSWRRTGEFRLHAETKGGADPRALLAAWDEEVGRLRDEVIAPAEIGRARSRLTADAYRSLRDPLDLMTRILIYDGLGDWSYLNRWAQAVGRVGSDDLQRAVIRYLEPADRAIAIFRARADEAAHPEIAGP